MLVVSLRHVRMSFNPANGCRSLVVLENLAAQILSSKTSSLRMAKETPWETNQSLTQVELPRAAIVPITLGGSKSFGYYYYYFIKRLNFIR